MDGCLASYLLSSWQSRILCRPVRLAGMDRFVAQLRLTFTDTLTVVLPVTRLVIIIIIIFKPLALPMALYKYVYDMI